MRSFRVKAAVTIMLAGGLLTTGYVVAAVAAKGPPTGCPAGYQLPASSPWLLQAMRRCRARLMRLATEMDSFARFRCQTRFA